MTEPTIRERYDQKRAYWKQRYADGYSPERRMFCFRAKAYVPAGTAAQRVVCHQACREANLARTALRNLVNSNLVRPVRPLARASDEYNHLAAIARGDIEADA